MTDAEINRLVCALRSQPSFQRARTMDNEMEAIERMVATAESTGHKAYRDMAEKMIGEFSAKWFPPAPALRIE